MEEKNNKEYFRGLVTGALIGVIIILMVLTVSKYKSVILTDKTPESSDEVSLKDIHTKMDRIFANIDRLYLNEVDMKNMEDAVCDAMMDSLGDVYSVYYNEDEMKSLLESTNGSYCGIGVAVGQKVEDMKIYITNVFSTSPAKKAGLQPGDQIIAVDDKKVDTNPLDTVVTWVKGEEGTEVTVTVLRDGKEIKAKMTRSAIEIDTIFYKMLENNIGYIQVAEFDEVTMKQFSDAVSDLQSKGMKKIIVDLRDNPGGRMDVVCDMVNTFVEDKKLILYTEDKNGEKESQYTTRDGELVGMPTVILVNGNSASASEVFTGVIKDYELGTVVGTRTFGKGIVQRLVPLGDDTALKITYSKYYTPKGINIHGTGIEPDIEVNLPDDAKSPLNLQENQKDTQLEKALELLK